LLHRFAKGSKTQRLEGDEKSRARAASTATRKRRDRDDTPTRRTRAAHRPPKKHRQQTSENDEGDASKLLVGATRREHASTRVS